MQYYYDHVGSIPQVPFHGLAGEAAILASVAAGNNGTRESGVDGTMLRRRGRRGLRVGYARQAVLVGHGSGGVKSASGDEIMKVREGVVEGDVAEEEKLCLCLHRV